jgi:DNA modification methylase
MVCLEPIGVIMKGLSFDELKKVALKNLREKAKEFKEKKVELPDDVKLEVELMSGMLSEGIKIIDVDALYGALRRVWLFRAKYGQISTEEVLESFKGFDNKNERQAYMQKTMSQVFCHLENMSRQDEDLNEMATYVVNRFGTLLNKFADMAEKTSHKPQDVNLDDILERVRKSAEKYEAKNKKPSAKERAKKKWRHDAKFYKEMKENLDDIQDDIDKLNLGKALKRNRRQTSSESIEELGDILSSIFEKAKSNLKSTNKDVEDLKAGESKTTKTKDGKKQTITRMD